MFGRDVDTVLMQRSLAGSLDVSNCAERGWLALLWVTRIF